MTTFIFSVLSFPVHVSLEWVDKMEKPVSNQFEPVKRENPSFRKYTYRVLDNVNDSGSEHAAGSDQIPDQDQFSGTTLFRGETTKAEELSTPTLASQPFEDFPDNPFPINDNSGIDSRNP